jgi:hypothetical protein
MPPSAHMWCFFEIEFLIRGKSICCITQQQYSWLDIIIWSWVEFWRCAWRLNIFCCVCLIGACFGFFVVQDLFASNPSELRYIFAFMCSFKIFKAQKIITSKREQCTCYFLQFIVLQGNIWVFRRNIDKSKVKVRTGEKHFLVNTFENFYITIWSCMKLEDVLEVLPMLISDSFLD